MGGGVIHRQAIARRSVPEDLPQLIDLGEKAWKILDFSEPYDPMAVAEIYRVAMTRGAVIVAEGDGRVVGMMMLLVAPRMFTTSLQACEFGFFVEEEYRGVGTAMIEEAENAARSLGARYMTLSAMDEVRKDGEGLRATNLYRRLGYRSLEAVFDKEL